MAEAQRFTTRQSNLQSKIQEAVNAKKQQTASSSAATQAGSTTTPTVSETPKVTQTAKAMPSVTEKPQITPVSTSTLRKAATPTTAATETPTVNARDLLSSKPTIALKKAATTEQNLLWADTKVDTPTDVSSLVTMYDNADESVKWIIWDAIKENGIKIFNKIFNVAVQENPVTRNINNFFETTAIDTARTAISTAQWYLEKAGYSDILPNNTPFLWPMTQVYNLALNNSEIWNQIKEQRNSVFEAVFDKLEDRDQRLANRYWYKQAKKTADKWAEQWKGIEDAINEWNWDVVTTRVWETMWQMLPTLIAVMATRNPKAAAPTIFATIWGDAYKRKLVENDKDPSLQHLTPEQKDNLATLEATVEAWIESAWDLLELAPFMKWGKSIASFLWIKNALLSAVVNLEWSALVEWWEEVLTEVLQTALKNAYWWDSSVSWGELWQIFSDTFFIMQFVWLLWWYKWWIETHRRNVAEKALAHEAENFDNFNDFEAAAERWWIEDKELVADAWAKAKGLNAEWTIALKTDLESVRQQEAKSTKLYEERETVESNLEELREKPEENKTQISKLENRLQEIDNQLQQISDNIKEWEEIYWEQELPAERETQMPSEQAGGNLSEQTMTTVPEEKIQYKELDTPTQRYRANIRRLNSKTIHYPDSWPNKQFELKEDLLKMLNNMSEEAWAELLSQYDTESLKELLGIADRTLKSMKAGRNTRIKKDQLTKLYKQLNGATDLISKMLEENEQLKSQLNPEEAEWLSDYAVITGEWDYDIALSGFLRQNTLYWKHLVWLKNISIKELEWKITDKTAHKFSLMLARASQILWIDFNKVIWDNLFALTVWVKKDDLSWLFSRDLTKESLIDLLEELWNAGKDTSFLKIDSLMARLFKSWIYLATQNISISEATATLVHEFVHLLDYRRSIDLWLQAKMNPHYRIRDDRSRRSVVDIDYTLSWDKKWETFNNPEDKKDNALGFNKDYHDRFDKLMAWELEPSQLSFNEKEYANEMLYIYDPTEILARYAEQYYMWKKDKKLFDTYSKKTWYRTEEKFKELIDDFEALLKGEFADYQIEEWNRNYSDLMVKLDDFRYYNILVSDKQRLEDIKKNNPEMEKDAIDKMLAMQKDYVEVAAELEKLEWTISEEVRAEYATELDNLATNMWILEQTLQDYVYFTDKKVPIREFEAADDALERENLEEDWKQIDDENESFEEQEEMMDEMDTQIEEAWWIQNVDEWRKEYEKERKTQKKWEKKRNLVESRDWIWDAAKDILTPTMSRIYNINKRVAWRLTQMETQSWINIYRYTQKCQWFVDHMNSLKGAAKLEVTDALLNFWALASEQWEDIAEYKREEVAKLREVLLRHWFKAEDINDMFSVLNDLWTRYKEAWLSINLSDMYFPRVVKDYKWLIEYMSKVSGTKIEDKTKNKLMRNIQEIIDNPSYSDEEKEKKIRDKLTKQFPEKIKVGSKHSKERKLWLLSDWWPWIYAYYEDPSKSLAHYITTMEYAIQRQLFLWWQAKDLKLDIDTIKSSNEESVSAIVRWLVEAGQITEKQVNELQKCIIAVMDKKNTPRWIQRIKDLTYVMALTNYISAANQLEDIGVAIIENKWWLISSVKAIFSKAWIKYNESWLESAYEMFKTDVWVSNKLFAASWFNFTDRLGKKAFLNAAWTSMVKRAKNEKSRKYLWQRLSAMYWNKTAVHIMKKVKEWNYMTNWQIDIDVLTDLLYQLGTTQPIYASAMPVAYLRSPKARWFYALSMFSIRQADHIIQSVWQTYKERWIVAASVQAFWYVAMRMFFAALVWDIWDWLQWKWKEETWLWKWIDEWWEAAWEQFLKDYLTSFSKLWMLSDYDKETFKRDWIWWVVANKMYPYIIQELHKGRKSVERAFKNEDRTELVPMLRDFPVIWKQVVGWWNYFLERATKESKWDWWEEEKQRNWWDSKERNWWEEKQWNWD